MSPIEPPINIRRHHNRLIARAVQQRQNKALRKKRVAVSLTKLTRADRQDEHKARMAARKRRYLSQVPGFEAVPSGPVNAAIITAQHRNIVAGMTPADAYVQAQRDVARQLPPAPMVRSYRVKPSKSDNPKYRNPALRKAKRKCAA